MSLTFYFCLPAESFGPWPVGLPAHIHWMDKDLTCANEGDLDAARARSRTSIAVQLFLYPGDRHYFADSSLSSYDAEASALLTERVPSLLDAGADS